MEETIYVILKVLFDITLEVWFSIYIYLCCYVSSRRPSDVGSTVTIIVLAPYYLSVILNQSWCTVLTNCMLVSYADNICKGLIPRSDLT